MTYCLAIKVQQGLVFASDSRTNAGVDQLSTFSKMFTFGIEGQRVFVVLTAGNLATTQSVIGHVQRDLKKGAEPNLNTVETLEDAAHYLGSLSQEEQERHGGKVDTSASFILGGQIAGSPPLLCRIYPEGNFICATDETPYLQIGEVKYGKPILDRIIDKDTSLSEAALCALVSMDSTTRSNATVGPPIEVMIYPADQLRLDDRVVFTADDPYLSDLKLAWDAKLKEAFTELQRYSWQPGGSGNIQQTTTTYSQQGIPPGNGTGGI
ncbi:MAG: peptidase [Gammaproteobacteria bacterium]|jgi:putative proteasome-type protease